LAGPERSLRGILYGGSQTSFGRNRDPVGALQAKQNDAEPQGAGLAPKRDPEQRTGSEAEDSPMHRSHPFYLGAGRSSQP
jgi:hypothetical protein